MLSAELASIVSAGLASVFSAELASVVEAAVVVAADHEDLVTCAGRRGSLFTVDVVQDGILCIHADFLLAERVCSPGQQAGKHRESKLNLTKVPVQK
eukprot:CAMPEP_0184300298 /NCGR_PEP_ID=MMETSP1049-20130417/10732_1 /TAXON_ID=77928 /ORGANISM="Proteomonas sulcata, Strain CCMP704" /LENGTH=96 /DNA_ID=CAMNT_0026610971 /DNA_START=166 /DNA_END=456 /DNA_ORIENTATION=-